MKAIRNYKGYKGHIAVYLTKDDITKIIRDYFEDAAIGLLTLKSK